MDVSGHGLFEGTVSAFACIGSSAGYLMMFSVPRLH
jgi:hypothetical protein